MGVQGTSCLPLLSRLGSLSRLVQVSRSGEQNRTCSVWCPFKNQKSPRLQLYVYAGFLPDLFPDPDHGGVCFGHLLLCEGEYAGFFVESCA